MKARFPTFFVPLFLVSLLAALTGAEPLAEAQHKGRLCPKCKSTGKVVNPFMTEELIAMEEGVKFCSYVIEGDKKGRGIPWFPCERCRNPELERGAREAFEPLVTQRETWLEARRKVEELLQPREKLLYLETEHFLIAWNIPKIVTADKKIYDKHAAMHLYADRMEAFYADFLKILGIDDKEMRNRRHELYLFETQNSCRKAAQEYVGLDCWNAAKLPGNPSRLISWKDPGNLKTDENYHRHLVHHVSHLLNVAYYRMEWLYQAAGWADEGLGHYFEMKYFNKADNTCDEEGEEEEFTSSDWEVEVRKAVPAGLAPPFADISIKTTTALHGDDHKYSWSYVDFLMKRDPLKFKLFMKGIKEKRSARDALKESYGLNYISFQNAWESYVLENYREKPLKPEGTPSRRRR